MASAVLPWNQPLECAGKRQKADGIILEKGVTKVLLFTLARCFLTLCSKTLRDDYSKHLEGWNTVCTGCGRL